MTVETSVAQAPPIGAVGVKSRGRIARFARGLFRVTVLVLALYCAARLLWRFSGSNQWELFAEKNGAKVFTLKQPGSDLKLVKGSVVVRSTMSGIVAWLQDPEACKDAGCADNTVDRIDDQLEYTYFRINMKGPLTPRDFVLRTHFHQIPTTKELLVEYSAAPDKKPANDCCLRVTNMNTTWRFTPLGNGLVEAEYTMNMDWGGYIPDLMSNLAKPRYTMVQLQQMQKYLSREKYQTAKYDFIQEQ